MRYSAHGWSAGELGARGFDLPHLDRIYNTTAVRLQRARTRQLLDVRAGDLVLDRGCGAGHLTTDLAVEVSPAGLVVGLDQQASVLTGAAARVAEDGVADNCAFARADACSVPLKDKACHRLAAVQVLEYVADVAGALAEVHRVLAVGGRAVLIDTDWGSCVWHTNDREGRMPSCEPGRAISCTHTSRLSCHGWLSRSASRRWRSMPCRSSRPTSRPTCTASEWQQPPNASSSGGHRDWQMAGARMVRSQTRRGTYFFSLNRFAVVLTRVRREQTHPQCLRKRACSASLRSIPTPGASERATRPSLTGVSSAKPPYGSNTFG